jgi:hypothetical protein
MTGPLVVPFLLLAAVLLVSGVAKVADRQATEDMFTSLRVPVVPPVLGARVLPYAEIALALLLLVLSGPLLVVAAVLALLVFLAYWLLIARALTFDPRPTCACFGRLGGHRVGPATLARNTILVALAVVALVAAPRGDGVLGGLVDFSSDDAVWLSVLVVAMALTWFVARTDEPAPEQVPEGVDGDYVRLPIPYGVVEDAKGRRHTLRELAKTQARLLVMLNPGCGGCKRIASRVDEWTRALDGVVAVHPVYTGRLDQLPDLGHARETTLHQPESNVSHMLGSNTTPAAVLLGADGLLAGGPVYGENPVTELVEDILEELGEAAEAQETAEPPPHAHEEHAGHDHAGHDHNHADHDHAGHGPHDHVHEPVADSSQHRHEA